MSDVPRHLVIRADASQHIGIGHVMRCLALAQVWQDHGGTVTFAFHTVPALLEDRIRGDGFDTLSLPTKRGSLDDAEATKQLVARLDAVALVLDGYDFDAAYQRHVRSGTAIVVVIDDYAHVGEYEADFLVDQNVGTDSGEYLGTDLPKTCLLGPRFALLRREYRRVHLKRTIRDRGARLLVSFGGGEHHDLTSKVLLALNDVVSPRFEIRVVVGFADRPPAVESSKHHVELLESRESLLPHLLWADLAVLAAGSTTLEAMATGLPAVLVPVADNQRPVADAVTRAGAGVKVVAGKDNSWLEQLPITITRLAADPLSRRKMARNGQALVDGSGAERVASMIEASTRGDPVSA